MAHGTIQDDPTTAERFIPLSSAELADLLTERQGGDPAFQRFIEALAALYDVLYARMLEELKRLYLPFNPDRDTQLLGRTPTVDSGAKRRLIAAIETLLQDANFDRLDQRRLNEALNKTSPYGVEVSVNLDEFQEILLFYGGTALRTDRLRRWKTLFLRREAVTVPIYRRLFVLLQMPSEDDGRPAPIYMKLFKDIPHSDLETIFPNTKVKMRPFDKIKLAVTGGGGAVTGIAGAVGKLTAATNPTAAAGAVAALGGIIWKQVSSVLVQRTRYMMRLAQNLYFYNLDNNLGALAYLVELASAEEHKEALLAYHCLLERPGLTEAELDRAVEALIAETTGVVMDYEVHDGLGKLRRLGLLREADDGALTVPPPAEALEKLEEAWIALFPA